PSSTLAICFFFNSRGAHLDLLSFPTRRSSDLLGGLRPALRRRGPTARRRIPGQRDDDGEPVDPGDRGPARRRLRRRLGGSGDGRDRKSTRLNSSHVKISYAVFCLEKKNTRQSK